MKPKKIIKPAQPVPLPTPEEGERYRRRARELKAQRHTARKLLKAARRVLRG